MEEQGIHKSRKFRFPELNFSNKFWIILTIIVLAAIILFAVWIRVQNIPQLKDITTGNYTLGPDLDPFWFMRVAGEIVQYGHPLNPDMMRYAPNGFPASYNLHSYMMAWFYQFLHIFNKGISFEFASIIFPVVCFALVLLTFFLFAKKLFSIILKKPVSPTILALTATALLAVIPEMLHRTTAGIPEHEVSGMIFFFLAFYFFLSAFEHKEKKSLIFASLSGISTALMFLTWGGGSKYIFMAVALATFIAFLFNKIKEKEVRIYGFWLFFSFAIPFLWHHSISLAGIVTSFSDTGFACLVLSILLIDLFLFSTKMKNTFERIKIPRRLLSTIAALLIIFVVMLVVSPSSTLSLLGSVFERALYPFGRTRIGLTVAENKAPYFTDVFGSFGPLFWIFFLGAIFLFYNSIRHFEGKHKKWINFFFIVFLLSFIFSRISSQSVLNGENLISKLLYFGGLSVFAICVLYIYIEAHVKKDEKTLNDFKEIDFSNILLLSLVFWMIVSMRGAIRLFFIICPVLIIAAVYFPAKIGELAQKAKDSLGKVLLWCVVIVVAVLLAITFINYAKASKIEVQYTVPSPYYQQWQKAMAWTRDSTPENSIFAHWWDYGYWLQTVGKRPTIVDGGNLVGFWDHLIGRYVLCGQNETEALEFLYAHNASYLLIDSSDIGKYPAYSSIGSDETGKDRLSWISTFVVDEQQTQELRNGTQYVYAGGTMLDQDIIWQGQLFPSDKAGIGAFILTIDDKQEITDAKAIFMYNGKQTAIPIRYVYVNNELIDISDGKDAVNSTLYFVPLLMQKGINNMGAVFYLSEKIMKSEMVKLYLLDQTENFELVHSEPALFIQQLRDEYGINVGDFLVANDIYGPIKIWKINYPEGFTLEESKLKRYLSFESDLPFQL